MIRKGIPSDRHGFVMLATLAIVSAFSAYVENIRSGDVRWLASGSIILASWPDANFVIIPVNNLLYGMRNVPADGRTSCATGGCLNGARRESGSPVLAYSGGLSKRHLKYHHCAMRRAGISL